MLRKVLELLPAEAMLLTDAGFTGYELLKALMDRGNSFLIRVGSNVQLIEKLGYAVSEWKQTVYLWPMDKQGRNKRSMPRTLGRVRPPLVLRLIRLKDAKGRPVCLLTNVLQPSRLSDRAAARMYRFKWIKQHRHIEAFFGTTPNAVKTQLWVAVIVYVLVVKLKHRYQLPQDANEIFQILGLTILEKTPVFELFYEIKRPIADEENSKQLTLFE